ncbi:hypothetical protein LTR10_003782 [Elasticomyces elasticus]|nr:hypothetical protein LTR10_003782 [Elasticomyces elasticus]
MPTLTCKPSSSIDHRAMEHPKNPLLALMKQINDRSWLFAGRLVISKTDNSANEHSWGDGKGVYYTIADAPHALPRTQDLPADGDVQLVYDAGGVSAVWALGSAYCKIKVLEPQTTREHVTLEYLQTRTPLSFAIPRVIYQREFDDFYCIVLSKVEGVILDEAWDEMDERMKRQFGIIDWETAGFVPKEWIRTKFRVSSGLNLAGDDQDCAVDWRVRVQRQLGEVGYKEVADEWMEWFSGKV